MEKTIKQYKDLKQEIKENFKSEQRMIKELEEKKRTAHYKIQDEIYKIQNRQYKSDSNFDKKMEEVKESKLDTRNDLEKFIKEQDELIYLLEISRDKNKKNKFHLDRIEDGRGEKAELLETYESEYSKLGVFLVKNDRPTNQFNIAIVGFCPFAERSRDEIYKISTWDHKGWTTDLKWDYDAPDNTQLRETIEHDLKFFKDENTARAYAKKGIKKLWPNVMGKLINIENTITQTANDYKLEDFNGIIEENLIEYTLNNCASHDDFDIKYLMEHLKPIRHISRVEATRILRNRET